MKLIDTSALRQKVGYAEARQHLGFGDKTWLLAAAIFIMSGLIVGGFMLQSFSVRSSKSPSVMTIVALLTLMVVVLPGMLWLAHRRRVMRAYRLLLFAQRNGMQFNWNTAPHGLATPLFFSGHSSKVRHEIADSEGTLRIGGFHTVYGHGRGAHGCDFTYIAFPIGQHVPDMTIDSRSNNYIFGIRNLRVSRSGMKRVAINPMFDEKWQVYAAPANTEKARHFVQSTLVGTLSRVGKMYDIEVADGQASCYLPGSIDISIPNTMETVLAQASIFANALGVKLTIAPDQQYAERQATWRRYASVRGSIMVVGFGAIVGMMVFFARL